MLLIDALVPVSEVDCKLACYISDQYKPVVIAVNKWDLARDLTSTGEYADYLTGLSKQVHRLPTTAFVLAAEDLQFSDILFAGERDEE